MNEKENRTDPSSNGGQPQLKGYEHLFIENIEKEEEARRQYEELNRMLEQRRLAERGDTPPVSRRQRRKHPHYGRILLLCLVFAGVVGGIGAGVRYLLNKPAEQPSVPSVSTSVSTSVPDKTPQTSEEPPVSPEPKPPYAPVVRAPQEETVLDPAFFDTCLFLGDSITTGLELYDVLENTTVVADLGMGLYKAKQQVEIIKQANPERIFLLMGINDLADYSRTVEQIATSYVEFYGVLKQELPQTRIYVESLFPTAAKYDNSKNKITNEKIDTFNSVIQQGIDNKQVFYVDLSASLKDENGLLWDEVTLDGMHLKKAYYGYWMNLLMENVQKLEEYYQ